MQLCRPRGAATLDAGMQRASEDPAHEAFGRAPERARWSWPHRVFVFALGLLLCFATSTLFVIEKVESYAPRCIPGTPPLARLPAGQLKALRAELSSVMARAGGRVYAAGAVPPDVMWNDEPPERGSFGLGKDGLGRASYEIRRWAPDPRWGNAAQDDIVGDVFEFTSGGRAKRFFAQAAGTRCHRSALARPAPQPDGARNMAWINPDAASEVDVLFVRGRAVYRLADARPIGSERPRWSVAQLVAVSTLNRLACTASDGACTAQTARFVERASAAVCSLGRELESEYGEEGPRAVFLVRDKTQAILAAVVGQLRRVAPSAEGRLRGLHRCRGAPAGRRPGVECRAGRR